jgi:hypothetical protein
MSALGQKQTLSDISAMSALLPKADINGQSQHKPGQYLKVYFARIQAEAVPTAKVSKHF